MTQQLKNCKVEQTKQFIEAFETLKRALITAPTYITVSRM